MSVLVTGGAGFIGSHLVDVLLSQGREIVVIDDFNPYYPPVIKEKNISGFRKNVRFHLYRGSVGETHLMHRIFTAHRIDTILHCAARAGVHASIVHPALYLKTNVLGTLTLLRFAAEYSVGQTVLVSSSSVYGKNTDLPFRENLTTDTPLSPYAASKQAMERLGFAYHSLYGIPISIVRPFTVYGPGGRPDMAPFLFTSLIDRGLPLVRYGNGQAKRDYTYIDDFVSGILLVMEKVLPFTIYNLGNAHPRMTNELIGIIERGLRKKAVLKEKPARTEEMSQTWADISKARNVLGFSPGTTLEEGMERFLSWYRKNKYLYD